MTNQAKTLPPLRGLDPASLPLTPGQRTFYNRLERTLGVAPIVAVVGHTASGRTTLVTHLVEQRGAAMIDLEEVVMASRGAHELRADEAIGNLILEAFEHHDIVVIDDMHSYLSMMTRFVRDQMLAQTIVPYLHETAGRSAKQLVVVGMPGEAWMSVGDLYGERAVLLEMPRFGAEDYAVVAANILGPAAVADVDFKLLHRHASMLNGNHLRLTCALLQDKGLLTTEDFVSCLQDKVLRSNLHIHEVEALSFDSLPGSEHIVKELETHVVLPFENPALAASLGIKPKRGVLLHGPPGTGKTSIGRALAHRMKGNFFLIDGTFVTEPPGAFMAAVQAMVALAKASAPSVLFIDDADVLFEIEHVGGLARYLLTVLDGLESEDVGHVCVMMTAMDVRKVPQALTRSGRVELWLETRRPEKVVRTRIIQRWLGQELPGHEDVDYLRLGQETDGFTPADLRRIVSDAKLLYADDIVSSRSLGTAEHYLATAINDIVVVRSQMADLLGDDEVRVGKAIQEARR